ncbi:MAG: class I SAM-dependent methyltransferase [Candidatus Omnitrophica bacterium]|nr:class I SAM-dependent methyltransferase [Candidatus Omnitrophota bacterium]
MYKHSKFNYSDQADNLTVTYLDALGMILRYLPKDAKILEIGCGNGFMLKALLDRGYNNLYGIEPSQDAILKADDRIKDRIIVDVLRKGLYKSESFDLIFFFQTFDHIQYPMDFLSICYNLLSLGGNILAMNHDIKSFSARVLGEKSPIIDIEHMYLYSKETINKVFVKAGFRPFKIYSPKSTISFRHLIWLLPIPKMIKLRLLNFKGRFTDFLLNQSIIIQLGNLCIMAKKTGSNSK